MDSLTGKVNIAGVSVRLNLEYVTSKIIKDFDKRYTKFKSSGSKEAHKVNVNFSDNVPCNHKMVFERSNSRTKIRGRGMEVVFSEEVTRGSIFKDIHILDSLLRIIYSRLLLNRNGFLIHAAAAGGEIFTGPAGSGKTTSVRKNKDMLGDDVVALKNTGQQWEIFSTPFTGEFVGLVGNKSEKLERINILRSVEENINPGEIYSALLKNALYYMDYDRGVEMLTKYCADIAGTVPGRGYYKKNRLAKENRGPGK
ncbi:MAG: hypothetical protein ACQEQC_08595 [Elusimicrobiota bacterium]